MPKVDPETGEPMPDAPEGPEDQAGGEMADPTSQGAPDDSNAGGGSS